MDNKLLLHVGCGRKKINSTTTGFNDGSWSEIRLDIDPNAEPDIIGTMTDMSNVQSGSIAGLYSSHNIEHLYPHDVPVALKEFYRVLCPTGFAVITCPDLQSVAELVAQDKLTEPAYNSPAGPISPLDILYGHRTSMANGNLYMAHRCGFTKKVLAATLQSAGFKSIATFRRVGPHFDLFALATKEEVKDELVREMAKLHFPLA
jgi:predicted SAM-dependent methyltransferase